MAASYVFEDDKEINVTVLTPIPTGRRPKQDDPLRARRINDPPSNPIKQIVGNHNTSSTTAPAVKVDVLLLRA